MTVPAAETCERTLTSSVVSVLVVTIPFTYPSRTLVPPAPATILPTAVCVTAVPTGDVLPDATVSIWSAALSMIDILIPLAYVPGVFDATVTPVIVLSS